MIPQAIASAGPYADLWSHLKSMLHSLDRAMTVGNLHDLTQFDKERLESISELLRTELNQRSSDRDLDFAALATSSPFDPTYTLGLDLRQILKQLQSFDSWQSSQKLGAEKKLMKLQATLEQYIASLNGSWLPNTPPNEEFRILRDLLGTVLTQTESALQG